MIVCSATTAEQIFFLQIMNESNYKFTEVQKHSIEDC